MHKFSAALLCLLPLCTLAAQCPNADEFHHVAQLEWTIPEHYLEEGWVIRSTRPAMMSEQTSLAPSTALYVQLYPQNPKTNRESCIYTLKNDDQSAIFISNDRIFDPDTVVNPAFEKNNEDPIGFACYTTAGNATKCSWKM